MDLSHMVTARRKEREKEQRRKEIVDAAERLFFEKGYEGVCDLVRQIFALHGRASEVMPAAIAQRGYEIDS